MCTDEVELAFPPAGSAGLPYRLRMEWSSPHADVPSADEAVRGKWSVSICSARNSLSAVVSVFSGNAEVMLRDPGNSRGVQSVSDLYWGG